ncbi:MAG: hypothetical protein CW342_13545 [Thermoactinomycetaceae bacterium]|jgi:LmbE family N-acetylglucosaminyl deacetylase|nr:hypothetical protein [Bacillota bacterium]MBO2533874.1 hypothetical protein [Thermoactinomycetaceae bacterium]
MRRNGKAMLALLLAVVLSFSLGLSPLGAEAGEKEDPALWQAVRPLSTIVSFMNTGAHPDDERSALLAWLSLGQGVRTSSVIANRGEGGQNEIGDELGNGLGIIRSRELQEASRVTDVDLFLLSRTLDDPIYDFGFSKSPEETLEKWGEEVVYERLIRLIRQERPDILMPSFRDVPSQHGHHRAVAQLTLRAFADAANPKVFPQHMKEGLSPWQVKKLYLPGEEGKETLRFNIGTVDPVYGKTYPQLGEESRKLHKSQGMGRDLPVEDYFVSLELVKSAVGEIKREQSLFDGLPVTLSDWAADLPQGALKKRLVRLQSRLDGVIGAYPDRREVTKRVQQALTETRQVIRLAEKSPLPDSAKEDLLFRLRVKERQLQKASAVASRVDAAVKATPSVLTRGSTGKVVVTVTNGGEDALTHLKVDLKVPGAWRAKRASLPRTIRPGESRNIAFEVKVPENASFFDPYAPPVVQAEVSYKLRGETVTRTAVPRPTEQTVAVLPDWGMRLMPEAMVLNTKKPGERLTVTMEVTNYRSGPSSGKIRPRLPEGWRAEPAAEQLSFSARGETKRVTFTLEPGSAVRPGAYTIPVEAVVDGRSQSLQVQPIHYDHIGTSYWLRPAELRVQAFPLELVPGLKVGYVDSGFDQVGDCLRQVGVDVTFLEEEDLASGDLAQYDAIVVGIRAYLSRPDLLEHNDRLLEYVKEGGHVVMQYHKPEDNWRPELAPYPLQPGSPSIAWRVTDENAPVTFLKPDHPLLKAPNAITQEDFDGWVQERGLYFPSEWDSAYEPLLSMADPGEEPFEGGLLVADYGEGSYIYTSLVWYRQIQSQVPGGYRMFVNLISYPRVR